MALIEKRSLQKRPWFDIITARNCRIPSHGDRSTEKSVSPMLVPEIRCRNATQPLRQMPSHHGTFEKSHGLSLNTLRINKGASANMATSGPMTCCQHGCVNTPSPWAGKCARRCQAYGGEEEPLARFTNMRSQRNATRECHH
jgi:hypothetical protein